MIKSVAAEAYLTSGGRHKSECEAKFILHSIAVEQQAYVHINVTEVARSMLCCAIFRCFYRHATCRKRHTILMPVAAARSICSKKSCQRW